MEQLSATPKYITRDAATHFLGSLGEEFVLIQNPGYVHPPYEICPLAPRRRTLDRGVRAVLMDMDGTTTSTEELCLNALETTIRRATGWPREQWRGLDPVRDFPYIIGTSVTQNMEYLVDAYGKSIEPRLLLGACIEAAAWTLGKSASPVRKAEAEAHLAAMGMRRILSDSRFALLRFTAFSESPESKTALKSLLDRFAPAFPLDTRGDRVRAGIEIYYQRLHHLFLRIGQGEAAQVASEVLGDDSGHPIRPLPGIGILHALAKGWLGSDAEACAEVLEAHLPDQRPARPAEKKRLGSLGAYFERNPAMVALVTASTRYEAEVVLREVFAGLREEVETWPLPAWRKQQVQEGFTDPAKFYATMVTATDCHEIRLKPHRDLYSVALHQLGLNQDEFDQVIGFEDTEAGVISLRAAGVGLSCGVPFAGTQGHDFTAAGQLVFGGLPEVLFKHGLFLSPSLLA